MMLFGLLTPSIFEVYRKIYPT